MDIQHKLARSIVTGFAVAALWLLGICSNPSIAADYSPTRSDLCALGTNITQGCAAVRARTILDSSRYPWSAIGRLNVAGLRSRSHCTGVLIADRLVLTAAHCVYDKHRKKWVRASKVHFLAGFQRGTYVGHSTAVRIVVAKNHDVTSKEYRHRPRDDWAIVVLRDPVGLSAGYLGWTALNRVGLDRALRSGVQVVLAGYPAVRQYALSADMGCKGLKFRGNAALIVHRCAVMKGDSGAPLLLLKDGKASVVGVLSGGLTGSDDISSVSVPIESIRREILEFMGAVVSRKDTKELTRAPGRRPEIGKAPVPNR